MSSDSDDEFSYTNSVSILKALKKDISFSEENESFKVTKNRKCIVNEESNINSEIIVINQDNDILFDEKVEANNDSTIILSDDEINKTPINIISTIDNILKKDKSKNKKTPVSRRNLRRSKRIKRTITPPVRKLKRNKKTNIKSDSIPDKQISKSKKNIAVCIEDTNLCEANYEIDVKVWWMSQYIKKFKICRFENLKKIFKYFADKENIEEKRLLFTIGKQNIIVSENDTPDSLNINAATIIEGGVLSEKTQSSVSNRQDKHLIELKVQLKDRKRPLTISMRSTDRMEVLMHKTAIELGVDVNTLKFYFDGELINSNNEPTDLQLEGGECIDCVKQ